MNERILHVEVGKPPEYHLERAARMMEALERGEQPEPYHAIGFADLRQFLAIFNPYRWEALAALREGGPMTVAELARRVRRDDKNVRGDVEKLIEWQALVEDEQGRLIAPYSEIVVDVCLPQREAA
jgi:predicted transcriptional regulator